MSRLVLAVVIAWLSALAVLPAKADEAAGAVFAAGRAGFAIAFDGLESDLAVLTTVRMPGATLTVATDATARADRGQLQATASGWTWTAPDMPGLARLTFDQAGETITLNVFVLTPFAASDGLTLNGYRIGRYNPVAFRGLAAYRPPTGFIDLSQGPADLKVSPHFTLGQFLCKQQPGHDPTYLLVQPAMLLKLEALLEAANAKGWRAQTFTVMSGFRTPSYNAAIGNRTTSSRHLFGDAADIYIDADGDGVMDDLTGDGAVTLADAQALASLAETLADAGGRDWVAGGLSSYRANAAHGPFVHVDTRGYSARW